MRMCRACFTSLKVASALRLNVIASAVPTAATVLSEILNIVATPVLLSVICNFSDTIVPTRHLWMIIILYHLQKHTQ